MYKKAYEMIHFLLDIIFPAPTSKKAAFRPALPELVEKMHTQAYIGEELITLFSYKDPEIRELLYGLKYRNDSKAAKDIAKIIHSELIEYISELYVFENISNIEIVPIPLSKRKLKKRGYNQSLRIAKEIVKKDKERNIKLNSKCLYRKKDTPSQAQTKSRRQRKNNLKNAFEVKNAENLKNKTVFLLDDVTTTGTTLGEAKKELGKAGANRVICIAVAKS